MLLDVLRPGVLANHPGRYIVRQVDALEAELLLGDDCFKQPNATPSPPTPLPISNGERGANASLHHEAGLIASPLIFPGQ